MIESDRGSGVGRHEGVSEPRKTILGLVGASGSGGASKGPSSEWNLVFHLAAWRDPGAEVVTGERRCEMPVDQSEVRAFMERVQPYDVVEVEIEDDSSGTVTLLSRLLRTGVEDLPLRQIASELQKPVVISHPIFGTLQYERRYGWYSGRAMWGGQEIEISLECASPEGAQGPLEVASRLFQDQIDWQQRVEDYVIEHLLTLKNGTWLEDEEAELSREEFLSRMTLQSITVQAPDGFTFWHDDGDLFFGHTIQVSGDFRNGLTLADIPG